MAIQKSRQHSPGLGMSGGPNGIGLPICHPATYSYEQGGETRTLVSIRLTGTCRVNDENRGRAFDRKA